jgi:heat shock protein HspQ
MAYDGAVLYEQAFSAWSAACHNPVIAWPRRRRRKMQRTDMDKIRIAKFQIGQVVRHRLYPFRGVVFDIDPVFDNTDEWYESIPADVRPHKDQPFYHLFDETEYVAYVSEQNLLPDTSGEPVRHPQVAEVFVKDGKGGYRPRATTRH